MLEKHYEDGLGLFVKDLQKTLEDFKGSITDMNYEEINKAFNEKKISNLIYKAYKPYFDNRKIANEAAKSIRHYLMRKVATKI